MPKLSRFDPRNEKFKNAKHSDLPPIMRGDYVKAEGGGFISRETATEQEAMEMLAGGINKNRSLKDKLLGRNKETGLGLQQENAFAMNDETFPFDSEKSLGEIREESEQKDKAELSRIREESK